MLKKLSLFALLANSLILTACKDSNSKNESDSLQEVVVMSPIKKDITLLDEYTARLEPVESVKLMSRVGGYLESVNFKEGQFVKKGDLLFVIDPRTYEAELASVKAKVAEVKARVKLAKTNLDRAKELYAADLIAKEILETRDCEMLSANAALLSAQAHLRNAELNLEYAHIRAPISGRISEKRIDIGNLIVANSTVLTSIVKYDLIQAYFELSERDVVIYRDCGFFDKIDMLKSTGPEVKLSLFENDKVYKGVLNYCDNKITSETASLTLRADFENADGKLTPGMFGTISVPGITLKNAILIPENAIGTDLIGRYAMLLNKENNVIYRPVNVGQIYGKYRIIKDGISENDVVIVSGLQRAVAGIRVKPIVKKPEEK